MSERPRPRLIRAAAVQPSLPFLPAWPDREVATVRSETEADRIILMRQPSTGQMGTCTTHGETPDAGAQPNLLEVR